MSSKKYSGECMSYSSKLRRKASRYSWAYVLLAAISGILGMILLYPFDLDFSVLFVLNFIPVLATFLILFFKNEIENVRLYKELASEFDNLNQDFIMRGNTDSNLNNLKFLRKKFSRFY